MELRASALEDLAVNWGFWRGRRVFITGHTGFKGTWLSLWTVQLGASVSGYALASPSNPNLYEEAHAGDVVHSIHGDVRDPGRLRAAVAEAEPEIIFHMAAQALVRPSYEEPVATFSTNVMGTAHLLEAVRSCASVRAVVVVTSDKCYAESARVVPHAENDPLGGHDPYAASKACAEIVAASYRRSFFERAECRAAVATARAGNVIGGGDWGKDRLFPDLVRAFSAKLPVKIRNPGATRPWQHVLDPLGGYLLLAERLVAQGRQFAEAWNFGPEPTQAITVGEVAQRVAAAWGEGARWELDRAAHLREAPALSLDPSKARHRLGWSSRLEIEAALDWATSWYGDWLRGAAARTLCERQIARFMEGSAS